ncbi:MAG TPA: GNAT family protein [candidate division Zixibacteria bacterium]|nr:GNAT family protein [candidate division Zixibacteria bacterium]
MKGKLVTLRPPLLSDAANIHKYSSSQDIPRFTFVPRNNTLEKVKKFIQQTGKDRKYGTTFTFTIVPHEHGHPVGMIGLMNINKVHRRVEMGYWMGKKFRGKGYMAEAIKLLLNFAFRNLKLQRVQASTLLDNEASQLLLEKCGFKFEGILRQYFSHSKRFKDVRMHSILKNEFKPFSGS